MRAIWTVAGVLTLALLANETADAGVPGEAEAARIESIYYERGPQGALEALAQDYRDALRGPDPEVGRPQINNEISRLEAHTTRYRQYSPLVAIATQWCLERHQATDFPLHYTELLPPSDASPDAALPDVELDREMAKVLQINWINYANLTRSRTRGYVVDERQILLHWGDLSTDQGDQEDVRAAVNSLSHRRPAATP
jgi:hypothetical protein